MSMGIVGAIDPGGEGDLSIHYAVAATYSPQTAWPNKIKANCKRCGLDLDKGEGTKVFISSLAGASSTAYFCAGCVAWVQGHTLKVVERQKKDAAEDWHYGSSVSKTPGQENK
jgi:hypothetical protein